MKRKHHTPETRRLAHTRKNSAKAEQYLSQFERVHGIAQAWKQRERLERGQVILSELKAS